MLRLLGIGMLGFCAVWSGVEAVLWLRRRARSVEELEQGISLLGKELELAPETLENMMIRLEEISEGRAKQLFSGFRAGLEQLEQKSTVQLWQEAVNTLQDIPPEARRTIMLIGTVLGRYDMPEQLETIKAVERELGQVKLRMNEKLRQQEKVYLALSACIGGCFVILLA